MVIDVKFVVIVIILVELKDRFNRLLQKFIFGCIRFCFLKYGIIQYLFFGCIVNGYGVVVYVRLKESDFFFGLVVDIEQMMLLDR